MDKTQGGTIMFGIDFIVGVAVGAVLTVSSQTIYNWVKKQTTSVESKVDSAVSNTVSKVI